MTDDELAIRGVVERWVLWRDAGDWERFASVWHEDGFMMATWFQGPAADFIRVSREGFERGVSVGHRCRPFILRHLLFRLRRSLAGIGFGDSAANPRIQQRRAHEKAERNRKCGQSFHRFTLCWISRRDPDLIVLGNGVKATAVKLLSQADARSGPT